MFLKNHPDYAALPGARQNIPYAELGIMAIFISKRKLNENLFLPAAVSFVYTNEPN